MRWTLLPSPTSTFVIISGDSISRRWCPLRENDKKVIGVGVKQSTSDLPIIATNSSSMTTLAAKASRRVAPRQPRQCRRRQRRTPEEERRRKEEQEARKTQAVELVVETFDALMAERGDGDRIRC